MIIDNIENISKYSTIISENVIEFLKNLSKDSSVGHYKIDENSYANIDQYVPKPYNKCKFEAHKKYIDIQMVLFGNEDLEYVNAKNLEISENYDETKDVMFFTNPETESDCVNLVPFKFAFIYPHEAHKPQIKTSSDLVKKVVVKIFNKHS